MLHTAHRLARADAVGIVGVLNNGTVGLRKPLQLTSLFPSQIMTEVGDRVAEVIIDNRHTVDGSQLVLPSAIVFVGIRYSIGGLGLDIAVPIVGSYAKVRLFSDDKKLRTC